MIYGHFDDAVREYVITRPDTPWPWINYLGSEDFFSLVSNAGGGYSFYRDARLRRLTRYRYNDVPLDANGRLFYIKDGASIWNPGWRPTRTELESYECRHGMGYTRIQSRREGIEAGLLFFVPAGGGLRSAAPCAEERVEEAPRGFHVFALTEFCLWNALDDMTNFQRNLSTGEVEVEGSAIYHVTEYRERRNHYAFYAVNAPVAGFDTDRESFTGRYDGFEKPAAVVRGRLSNTKASGWSPDRRVSPGRGPRARRGEELRVRPRVRRKPRGGEVGRPRGGQQEPRPRPVPRVSTRDAKVDRELAALRDYWTDLLSRFTVASGDERLDRMVNVWNQYQCMTTCNLARSASYFESGIGRGIGFRDTSQDLLGCVHQVPARVRERLFDVASTQHEDGGAWHQYQPLTKRGNADVGDGFNDDPLWLILGVAGYLKETGDWAFLEEQVPFDNNPSRTASLFEHLARSFSHVVNNLGPARPAAHRPGGLERLPQPQLFLHRPE